jgi:sugar lactone lactonase YvrE
MMVDRIRGYAMTASPALCALSAALILGIASACGGDGGGTGPAATGTLGILINQVDAVPETVHVAGPAGYSRTLTVTTTLAGVPVGEYLITADSQEVSDPIVGGTTYKPQIAGSRAIVSKNEVAQANVTYVFAHQRGALWIANVSESVEQYGTDQLRTTRVIVPNTQGLVSETNGLVFSANGDMWVSSLNSQILHMYSVAARNAGNPIHESRLLDSPDLFLAEQMAFDANGTLWVADYLYGLVGFSAEQVAAGGPNISAAIHMHDADHSTFEGYAGVQGIAIDSAGDVWVTEANTNEVVEFSASQIESSGTVSPVVRLASNFSDPSALAFDSHGDLWVTNESASSIVMFTPGQLTASGAPIPTVTITTVTPSGLAFDNSGDLWVSDKGNAEVHEYTPAQLLTTSSPVPVTVLTRGGTLGPLAFDKWTTPSLTPPPSGVIRVNRTATKRDSSKSVARKAY